MKKRVIFPIMASLLIASLPLAGCSSTEESSAVAEVEVGENQKIVYGMITSIVGNQITYSEVDEELVEKLTSASDEDNTENKGDGASGGDMEMSTEMGEMPSGGPSGGGMPSGDSTSGGEMPSGDSASSGEMPSGDSTSGGEMPSGDSASGEGMPSGDESISEESTESGNAPGQGMGGMSDMLGESVSTMIPVGVVVHTTSDTETTFSRLASGDLIEMLVETTDDGEEVIEEIWIVQ